MTKDLANRAASDPLSAVLNFRIPGAKQKELQGYKESRRKTIAWDVEWYKNDAGKGVRVSYADNIADSETLAQRFIGETVIGFDMEWKPKYQKGHVHVGIKNNVSLIQMARDGEVGLFHIARHRGQTTSELFAPTLVKLIRNAGVMKTGVNIYGADASRLRQYTGIEGKGLFELSRLHWVVTEPQAAAGQEDTYKKHSLRGLAKQVEEHLGFPLAKGKVRTSDWTQPLTEAQKKYAAADAYAGLILYHTMNAKRLQLDPVPPLPRCAEMPDATARIVKAESKKKVAGQAEQASNAPEVIEISDDDEFETGDERPAPKSQFRRPPPLMSSPSPELDLPDSDIGPLPLQPSQERYPLQELYVPPQVSDEKANKRQREPDTAQSMKAKRARTSASTRQPAVGASERFGNDQLLRALKALRRQLVVANPAHQQIGLLKHVSEETMNKIAAAQPKTVPDLCRIPGAVPLMQFCKGHDVDLIAFVREHG